MGDRGHKMLVFRAFFASPAAAGRLVLLDRDRRMDLVVENAGAGRGAHAGQDAQVKQLGHSTLEPDPMDNVAGTEIDDLNAAPGFRISFGQFAVQRQSRERAVPRQGQADNRESVVEGEPAQKARAEYFRLEGARLQVDGAEDSRCRNSAATTRHPPSGVSGALRDCR